MTAAGLPVPLLSSMAAPRLSLDPETARLVARARDGEREAFGELLQRHLPAARRLALAALGRPADADEAVQDASLAAWKALASLETDEAFRAWFLRIVWRKALDRRRSLRALLRRFVGIDDEDGRVVEPSAPGRGAEALAIDGEMARAASRIVHALPRRLRDPFLLAASGDHRYEEIAALLGVPVGTVKWRVSEARRVAREKLDRLGWGGGR
ncbi:MAG: RNA polymerase sigma factor [Acidobacteria bacterium]|nr:RNA polymerase sigma factor [Acidobacteriota bacterium]